MTLTGTGTDEGLSILADALEAVLRGRVNLADVPAGRKPFQRVGHHEVAPQPRRTSYAA